MAARELTERPRLSLEAVPTPEEAGLAEIALYLDRAGLALLKSSLERLAKGELSQVHLLSELWGGLGLTEERWRGGGLIAQHVKILLRPDGETPRQVRFDG